MTEVDVEQLDRYRKKSQNNKMATVEFWTHVNAKRTAFQTVFAHLCYFSCVMFLFHFDNIEAINLLKPNFVDCENFVCLWKVEFPDTHKEDTLFT